MSSNWLGLTWQIGFSTGWGVFGWNLALEAEREGRFRAVSFQPSVDLDWVFPRDKALLDKLLAREKSATELLRLHPDGPCRCDFPVLHSCANAFFEPSEMERIQGSVNLASVFSTETEIQPAAKAKASSFSLILAGSSWCAGILRKNSITNVATFLQGVDHSIFQPRRQIQRDRTRFFIFSGGKLEYRKGQDIIVAAFRKFHRQHPNAMLVTNWHNAWRTWMDGIELQGHVHGKPQKNADGNLDIPAWLESNGIPRDACYDLGCIPNYQTPDVYATIDAAVFTNRCEGGTNLVAMECLACGVPTILSANTGHLDLAGDSHCYPLTKQSRPRPDPRVSGTDEWGESDVEEVVEHLERIYQQPAEAERRGAEAVQFMQSWTWKARYQELLGHLENLGQGR